MKRRVGGIDEFTFKPLTVSAQPNITIVKFVTLLYLGAILCKASAAALSSVAGYAVIASLFGVAGAGLTGYKMKLRFGGIDEFKFKPLTVSKQLNVTIVVSSWLSDVDDSKMQRL